MIPCDTCCNLHFSLFLVVLFSYLGALLFHGNIRRYVVDFSVSSMRKIVAPNGSFHYVCEPSAMVKFHTFGFWGYLKETKVPLAELRPLKQGLLSTFTIPTMKRSFKVLFNEKNQEDPMFGIMHYVQQEKPLPTNELTAQREQAKHLP